MEIVATVSEERFTGRAVVDWLDDAGEIVSSERLEVRDSTVEAGYRPAGETSAVSSVRVYVWNEEAGVDAMGALALPPDLG